MTLLIERLVSFNMVNVEHKKTKEKLIAEIHELVRQKQDLADAGDKLMVENSQTRTQCSVLLSEKAGLEVELKSLKRQISEERGVLSSLGELVSDRSASLDILNRVVARISKRYAGEIGDRVAKLKKLESVHSQYQEAAVKYAELTTQIDGLVKEKKAKTKEVKNVKIEERKIKSLVKEGQADFEGFRTQQAQALKAMKFYARRLNRYYKSLNLPGPIEMPNL